MFTVDSNTTLQTKPFNDLWNGNVVSEYDEAEYWTLLPSEDKVHVLIDRVSESESNPGIIFTAAAWVRRADLLRHLRQLPSSRWLHTLTMILPKDNDDQAALGLLSDCIKLGQKGDFTVLSMISAKTTSEIVAALPFEAIAA